MLSGARMTREMQPSHVLIAGGVPDWLVMLNRYTLPAIWPPAGTVGGSTGATDTWRLDVPSARTRAPGSTTSWACAGTSVVAAVICGDAPPGISRVAEYDVGDPAWSPAGWR